MSASQTSVGTSVGEASVLTEQEFAAAVRRDGNLDNLGAGVDWDGARCEDCRTPVPDGAERCDECEEPEPHLYPCPTCGGNGCPSCGDNGERIEWAR